MGYLLPFDRSIQLGQKYGARPGLSPNPLGGHNGDDWLTVIGTPVRAAGDGEVIFAGEFDDTYADNFGWNLNYGGNMVVLNMDGDAGPYFEYGHLSKIYVKAGQQVRRGDIIALTGNSDGGTGVSTGPHCHVGALPPNFNLGSSTYGRVNPRIYMTDYWDGDAGTISPQGETISPLEEDDMFTEEDRKLLRATLDKADGGTIRSDLEYQNGTLFSKADGAWQNGLLADIAARLGNTLDKADGGYIVGLLDALKPGATDAGAIAEAVVAAVGKDIAADVVKSISEKLGAN
jgi:hypothetical protein